MTHFETIILIWIYIFCYGYTLAAFIKEKNIGLGFLAVVSFIFAFGAPFFIGGAVYGKLNNQES